MTILTDAELLQRIEAFLARTGMAPTRFGRDVMAEASLIATLRNGRSLSLKNVNKLLGFMADYEAELNGDPDEVSSDKAAEIIPPFPVSESGVVVADAVDDAA